jgi:hypothetical protein
MAIKQLTPEVMERLVAGARAGRFRKTNADENGTPLADLDRCLEAGRAGGRYSDFAVAFDRATAQSEGELQDAVRAAVASKNGGDWKAGAWLLERRYPTRWGMRTEVVVDHDATTPQPTAATTNDRVYSPFKPARSA